MDFAAAGTFRLMTDLLDRCRGPEDMLVLAACFQVAAELARASAMEAGVVDSGVARDRAWAS
jgi:hypothetical protein